MLDERRRRSADVVYMLYKCFVFTWDVRLGMVGLSFLCIFVSLGRDEHCQDVV